MRLNTFIIKVLFFMFPIVCHCQGSSQRDSLVKADRKIPYSKNYRGRYNSKARLSTQSSSRQKSAGSENGMGSHNPGTKKPEVSDSVQKKK